MLEIDSINTACPAPDSLPVYELEMSPQDLAAMEANPSSNETHPAKFTANGVVHGNARVRFRGKFARTWPKKPLKILLDRDQPFEGQYKLNLNSAQLDPAFVREPFAYHFFSACGVPSPRSRMVLVRMNGDFHGLYVEVEQPDEAFLKRVRLEGVSLFKAKSTSAESDERDLGSESAFGRHYSRKTHKADGMRELQAFCHDLAQTTDAPGFFTRNVDLKKYIDYLAANALVQNWDCSAKNHYMAFDGGGSGKWFVIPWDLDRTCGDHWRGRFAYYEAPIREGTQQLPGRDGWNRVTEVFFSEASLRERFAVRLGELLATEFTASKLFPMLDRLKSQAATGAALDRERWPPPPPFRSPPPDINIGIAEMKNYIELRRGFLLDVLRSVPDWTSQK